MPQIDSRAVTGARQAMFTFGVPASVALAQFGVESAWGRYEPAGSNNGFGIQELTGLPYVIAKSHEFRNGQMVPVMERFAKFESTEQAFYWHAKLLATNPVYRPAMKVASDPKAFAEALTGVYATAPHYGDVLVHLMVEDSLFDYDEPLDPTGSARVINAFPRPVTMITTVADLQRALNVIYPMLPPLDVDDAFGVLTRQRVAKFQADHGIYVDGDPGPVTDAAIMRALPPLPPTVAELPKAA